MKTILFSILALALAFNNVFSQSGWFSQSPIPTGNYLLSVNFISNNMGWTVGRFGTILKTTNGGNNWTNQISGTTEDLRSVHFIDNNTGWIVGGNYTATLVLPLSSKQQTVELTGQVKQAE